MNQHPLTPGDPRLTALACGEITDAGEARTLREAIDRDPALAEEYAGICAMQQALQAEFSAEVAAMPVPKESAAIPFQARKVTEGKPGQSARRQRSGWGGTLARPERRESTASRIIRYTVGAGVGIGAVAALVLSFSSPQSIPVDAPARQAVASHGPSETRLHLPVPKEERSLPLSVPGNSKASLPSLHETNLAGLVARLPVRAPGGGENAFLPTERDQAVPLNLASAGQTYASRLQAHLVGGRLPPREQLRIDGMVNAFLAAAPQATAPGITLDAEAVPAPWAPGHWLVRATVRAGEIDGTIVAKDAWATVAFAPDQVSSWRMLGCEDGPVDSVALDVPGTVRSGEMLTTLFELIPSATGKSGEALGEMKMVFLAKNGQRAEIKQKIAYPVAGGLATASDETRFAAAIASFGLVARNSQYRGTASLSMANQLAAKVENANKPLFIDLLREAAPLVR